MHILQHILTKLVTISYYIVAQSLRSTLTTTFNRTADPSCQISAKSCKDIVEGLQIIAVQFMNADRFPTCCLIAQFVGTRLCSVQM